MLLNTYELIFFVIFCYIHNFYLLTDTSWERESVSIHSHPISLEVYGLERVHLQTIVLVANDLDEEGYLGVRSSGATQGWNLYVRVMVS